MSLDRRRLFAALAGAATAGAAAPALARDVAARPATDATALGLRPNAPDDQSKNLQRAIDQAAAAGTVLHLPAGFYRAGALNLPTHAGVAGMTRIVLAGGPSMMSATGSDNIALSGLILDGANIPLPERRGLIHLAQGHALRIANKSGGCGQYGNAINVFRANNVMVRGNRISNAAFSAVRGNAASNLQILGNTCSAIGEVALYAEFGFEGAMIANNIVDGAALGVSVTNFNEGGRLAVVQGNIIRNLSPHRPAATDPNDSAGIGIGIEADTAVSGNVIENAPYIGIAAGWGQYLRDVTINANVVRGADYGVAVSVAPGAGAGVIADNMISGARLCAIVGMEWKKPVTGDLAKDGAERYAQLSVVGNRVR